MNFPTAIKTVLIKYIDFNGRASRSELWYWFLGLVVVSLPLAYIEGALLAPARRLHDIGRSGWWLLIQLIPVIGGLILLWWYLQPGTEESNEYG